MNFEKHLKALLYQNDFVTIPELGSFVLAYNTSNIDYTEGLINPPTKKILFNSNIFKNDGLLVNYIAEAENISIEEAEEFICKLAEGVKLEISQNKVVKVDDLGVFLKGTDGNLYFVEKEDFNFLSESFGLSPVKFDKSKVEEEKSVEEEKKEIKNSNSKCFLNTLIWVILIVIIFLGILWFIRIL